MCGEMIPKDHADEVADCFAVHAPGLFGYACVLTRGDGALADDLVQSAFMEAARQWSTTRCLREAQRVRWLQTTVSYQAISMFRRSKALRECLPRLEAAYRAPPPDTDTEAALRIALELCWRAIRYPFELRDAYGRRVSVRLDGEHYFLAERH